MKTFTSLTGDRGPKTGLFLYRSPVSGPRSIYEGESRALKILEDLDQWKAAFEQGWLAHFRETGEFDFKLYNRPTNKVQPSGPGIDLSKSRLTLISSAGGYLSESQKPFSTNKAELGDYSIRLIPMTTPLEKLAFAHQAYDHTAVEQDPQVLLPLRHLADMVNEGLIGELAPSFISFNGWQPDVEKTINEMIPAIIETAKAEDVKAALLVPA